MVVMVSVSCGKNVEVIEVVGMVKLDVANAAIAVMLEGDWLLAELPILQVILRGPWRKSGEVVADRRLIVSS